MELGLSLGDASKPFGFIDKSRDITTNNRSSSSLGFCMALSIGPNPTNQQELQLEQEQEHSNDNSTDSATTTKIKTPTNLSPLDPPLIQLDLLPNTPVTRSNLHALPWPSSDNGSCEVASSGNMARSGLDVNRLPAVEEAEDGAALSSSPPNSAASSFQMDFSIYSKNGNQETEVERASSRASDEDDNGNTRKKLRLSKEQSAFLEESFKEHSTLNPKQKLALAKQLNLRPRQVEVWFQNRRARTKLKQTEVDCEYLKRCCETLTEENRRLHKELQELRALKTSNPFYMQLPATTLTMCPSCERVATTTSATVTTTTTTVTPSTTMKPTSNTTTNNNNNNSSAEPTVTATGLSLARPGRFYPFSHHQPSSS
ncbi:hypothetical protein P3X46_024251 [Hevea brasiliensis]|uniref:Homeobox domain-containing protein n=1 Tax=Hevea brasiliensis TaxID=3981 RepID=A0ABQ9L3L5_HEVBR|nr:homeobox-leucine zipper protein HOX11 [Hevea brasiliensis]KAJ9158690.1 hypothetical protein P3X46_024251 [Hevea brasiliensis]